MTPAPYHGPETLVLDDAELITGPPGLLDSFTFKIRAPYTGWKAALTAAGFTKNRQLPTAFGFHSIWIADMRVVQASSLSAVIAINCLGLEENATKRKTTFSTQAERVSFGPVPAEILDVHEDIPDKWKRLVFNKVTLQWERRTKFPVILNQGHPAWNVATARGFVATNWFATSRPAAQQAGTAITPPETLFGTGEDFSGADHDWLDFRKNHPSGWVLESMEVDPLYVVPAAGEVPEYGLFAISQRMACYPSQVPM